MKKINLNQLSMSWSEKQTPKRFGRYAVMLLMLLTLGVGQMWGAELGNGQYIYINYSTSTWADASAKFRFNWYWNVGDHCCWNNESGRVSGENYAYAQTQNAYTRAVQILRFNSTYGTQWNYTNTVAVSSNTKNCITLTASVSDNYSFSWTTYAPPMSTVTLSDNGTSIVSGSGTSGDPYLVYVSSKIKVSASGTKAVADPDATIYYDFKQSSTSKQNGTGTTYEFDASASANTTYTINLDGYTKVSSTSSTKKAATALYYKTIEVPASYSLTVEAGSHISTVTGSTDPITLGDSYAISASNFDTGYEFDNWTASPAANASFASATSASTSVTVSNGSVTVTANAKEKKHTVNIYYKFGSTTIKTATTKSVSEVTASSISAPAISGYTFSNWTVGNGVTATTSTSSSPVSIKTKSSGTYSLTANYTEDLSTPLIVTGGNKIVTTGTTWRTTADAYNKMLKKTGHSTESVAYFYVDVDATNTGSSNSNYQFKIYKTTATTNYYGLTASGQYYCMRDQDDGVQRDLSTSGANIELRADVVGQYEIVVDYSTSTYKITVNFPTSYQLNYSIGSVAGTSGSISSSPTTATGSYVPSGNTVTLTAPNAKTGYTWKGWYLNSDGSGVQQCSTKAYDVTMNADKTLYACYTENTYNVSASASPAAGGSVTPTSATSMGQVTGGSITATPNPGYSFTSWAITTGSGYFGASGTATTSTTANTKFRPTAASTLTGTFSEIMRTVTVEPNNEYLGSVSSASLTSVGPATKSAEVTATAETGASFTRWDVESGVTIASGYTSTSNPVKVNATAASKTLTAVFTETTYTVSMSTEDASKGTVADASKSVGQITAVQITATPKSGYMFSKWVKTAGAGTVTYYTGPGNGQVTDASGEEKETTYICVTGAVTLQATWEPDRSSGYMVHYGNSGKDADGNDAPSQARAWKDGKLYRATTEASDVSYFSFTAGVGDVDKVIYFKIWDGGSNWYGYNSASGGKFSSDITDVTLSTSYGDARMCIIMPGTYKFTWNKSTKKLSVAYPDDVYYVRGGFNSWGWSHPMTETSSGVYSATVNMTEANHTYSGDNGFKLLIAGKYYGKNSTTVTRSTSTGSAAIGSCSTSGANIGITTDYTGNYTFTYTVASNTLQVTYPTAYKVTYGKGTVDGSASNCSAIDITNGGTSVTSNSTWVKSGNQVVLTAPAAKSGYRYLGWYNNNSATGDAITTNANCTTTVNADAITRYACYAENMSTITVSAGTGGTVTTGSGSHSLGVTTTQAINASASNGYSWSTWTTSGNAALGTTATTKSNTAKADGTNGGSGTITATFTPNNYDIILDVNGGSGANQTVTATFAAAMPTTLKGGGAIAARTKTGYKFDGYTKNNDGTGTKYYTAALASNANLDIYTDNTHIYAKWNAKQSAITFDYQTSVTGYASSGNITNATGLKGTYGANMTALTGTMPSAANGYAFMGFYDATSGGTKYYNADGTSARTWNKDTEDGTTLYARWAKAEITEITFSPGTVVENNSTVTVTATVSPTPTGTTTICWRVLYNNDSPLSPQPTFDPANAQGNSVSFTAPDASGMYKVEAVLHTGSGCAGSDLDTRTADFQVAGSHTVTVAYKHSSTDIKTSTSVTGRPLDWSDPITAPDIFAYTFDHWSAGDGITLSEDGSSELGKDESSSATIYIKATYNGTLTANYTPKNIIYFKDNLEWTDPEDENAHIYVNLLTADYWNNDNGSGNEGVTNRNLQMDRVPGTTNIFYYDYGNKTTSNYISFTKESMDGYTHFYQAGEAHVVFPCRSLDALGTNKATGLGFYAATPMFVPLATQTPVKKNDNHAAYYNDGYWTKYLPGTGYSLDIYQSDGSTNVKIVEFTSADELMPMKVVTDLEGGHTYKFQLKRDGDVYYGNSGTMTYNDHGQNTAWEFNNSPFSMCTIETNAAGNYTFNLSFSPNSGGTQNRLRISVDYPVADGDYRLVYSDDTQTKPLTSAIVNKENNGTDIVSFFVRKYVEDVNTPVLRIQQATVNPSTGAITWNEYPTSGTPTNQITGAIRSAITKDSVWNFNLAMNGEGALSIASVEGYTGNYYIRTDAANSKWDNYRTDPDHLMTYSDYLKSDVGYTHYYTHWVKASETGRKNVKFVIANDYSPNISDTLARESVSGMWAHIGDWMEEGGDLKRNANIRFMWDMETNAVARAYVDGAQEDGSEFLLMLNTDSPNTIKWADGTALTSNKVTFSDNGNWIYEANIKAQPGAAIKLKSTWGNTANAIVQYFKGSESKDETLIGGSTSDWYDIRVIYDFKTNRLVASYVPSTGTITEDIPINADVMFIREHQGDIAQLTFTGSGAISKIETAYGVMRFNKWTINNKAKAEPHSPLAQELSRYERDLFYISFPFRVNLEEVFGFGTYGTHWIIEEYDGAARAKDGFWADSKSFWKYIFNRKGKFLEPNVGYLLALDLDELGESSSVWANTEQVELYFPSYGSMPNITKSTVTHELPAHTCTIGPRFAGGDDRRVKDSHWNIMSVPTYINTNNVTFANTDWITTADAEHVGPNFLYTWNMNDNTLSATSGTGYIYKAMHAYIVQYCGNVTWTTSVSPATAPQRNPDAPKDAEYRLELRQNDVAVDQTFVRLSNDEHVTTGFEFNYDLSKEFNKNKASIYTMVTTMMEDGPSITETAGNCLPMTEQTTVVPVGVIAKTTGDYTFAIPEGTNGVGVTLIDNETGIRTSLSALDYTVNLNAGTYNERFVLEISPIKHMPTGIEMLNGENGENGVRKILIDGILYIVKDGKMFDARGARVQ